MPTKFENLQKLSDCGVVAVIRASSPEQLPPIAEALLAGGLIGLEVTMTTPKAIAGIEKLADAFGDRAVIGVGTVLDAATARDAISAGSQFVVSPMFDRAIVETTLRYGKLSMPGSYTPTEIMTAFTAGADVVKVFPSAGLGPQYFKDILAPLPQLRLMPTGGTDPSECWRVDQGRCGVSWRGVVAPAERRDRKGRLGDDHEERAGVRRCSLRSAESVCSLVAGAVRSAE